MLFSVDFKMSEQEGVYKCKYCYFETAHVVAMMHHCHFEHADHSPANIKPANVIGSTYQYSCVFCRSSVQTRYNEPEILRRHSRVAHPFDCQDCMKQLHTWERFLKHARDCSYARADLDHYSRMQSLANIP